MPRCSSGWWAAPSEPRPPGPSWPRCRRTGGGGWRPVTARRAAWPTPRAFATWPSWWPTRGRAPRPRPGRPDRGGRAGGRVGRRDLGDAGPLLDGRARSEYRRRVEQLRSEIDDAFAADQPERAEAAQAELDVLVRQLAQAFGLGGRDRRAASAAERARLDVTHALRAATARLEEALPETARALDRRLRTGLYCAYEPAADDDHPVDRSVLTERTLAALNARRAWTTCTPPWTRSTTASTGSRPSYPP